MDCVPEEHFSCYKYFPNFVNSKPEFKMAATIYAFVKICEKIKYAEDLVAGKLFMNQIRRFKEYKDEVGELRGDEYEGIVALFQPNKVGMIKIGDKIIPFERISSPNCNSNGSCIK